MLEVERKFLITNLQNFTLKNGEDIVQGYINLNHTYLRLRKINEKYFICIKSHGTVSRKEWEVEIPIWVFSELWDLAKNNFIRKTRYRLYFEEQTFFIDKYYDKLKGLLILESEFPDTETAFSFNLPTCINAIKEVTYDIRYQNHNLAFYGLPETL